MMNATVARIVELMFEDLEMSDEVQAIRDEVMNNCQERFEDLVARGMSEDEATAAVVESLKGMDEVLAAYPRKHPYVGEKVDTTPEEDEKGTHCAFAASMINEIVLELLDNDLEIIESDDDMVHVDCNDEHILTELNADQGRLVMKYPAGYVRQGATAKKDNKHFHIDMQNGFDLKSLMEQISSGLSELASNIRAGVTDGENVVIRVPAGLRLGSISVSTTSGNVEISDTNAHSVKVNTTSGDVTVEDFTAEEVRINTTSGDIEIHNDEAHMMQTLRVRTTSGDVEGDIFAKDGEISTISGDLEVEGRHGKLNVATTSGDVSVRGDVQDMQFRSVSGDIDMTFDNDDVSSIQGHTVSGDVDVHMPDGVGVSECKMRSTSGNTDGNMKYAEDGKGVKINITTVSGDIDVR